MNDGSSRETSVTSTRGGPNRPLTDTEVANKFRSNVHGRISDKQLAHIQDLVHSIDSLPDIGSLTRSVGSPQP